jgi:molybdopterin-guanine dinucleotide biosynthesis protein A
MGIPPFVFEDPTPSLPKDRDRPEYMVTDSAGEAPIAGIVLAGGQARRLGGDKALRPLGGRPLLAHVIARARPQVAALALSANGDPAPFAAFGLPLLPDPLGGFPGPLAGILAGMEWAAASGADLLASFPCDAPFFPADLVARLAAARAVAGAAIACAASSGRVQPLFALWPVALRTELRHAIAGEGIRKVDAWAARHSPTIVPFTTAPFDPFFNVNTPADLAAAETLLAAATRADNGGAGD